VRWLGDPPLHSVGGAACGDDERIGADFNEAARPRQRSRAGGDPPDSLDGLHAQSGYHSSCEGVWKWGRGEGER